MCVYMLINRGEGREGWGLKRYTGKVMTEMLIGTCSSTLIGFLSLKEVVHIDTH